MSQGLDGELAAVMEHPENHGQWLVDFIAWDPFNRSSAATNQGVAHYYGTCFVALFKFEAQRATFAKKGKDLCICL